ncbi:putative lipoprotein [Vibrio mimicus VM223]|nr:putative lipoprotein [Vibrio mimicus VM223]
MYGAVGYNKVEVSRETDQFVREFNEGGASGEVGVNLQVLPFYKLVPRARFTRLAGEIMDDYQLSNQIMFGPVLAVELNIGHNKFQDTSQTSYQAGIRFSF